MHNIVSPVTSAAIPEPCVPLKIVEQKQVKEEKAIVKDLLESLSSIDPNEIVRTEPD
jgi:hypothetical protein